METKIDIFEKIIAKIQDKVDYADIVQELEIILIL